jgi:chalcone synthase
METCGVQASSSLFLRRRTAEERNATSSEGLDLGVLFRFGPGVKIQTIVLRSFATDWITN